ncbi:hypothetical protein [Hasllibacter halocynthiae]|uniref:hypothetical protein n=1 Tax=Hasllibacter halocynthiae TaxID=595589 RepID=UPI0011B20F2A|nr:hypothetical protein [Hasllibacter halocynthiae]
MEEISKQLLYQRLRNRVIELLDLYSSLDDIATLGAFETIDMVDDWLPLDYAAAPKVFSEKERVVIAKFLMLSNAAADATDEDTWKVDWFRDSEEWVNVSRFSEQALAVFCERGRFSEESEEDFPS